MRVYHWYVLMTSVAILAAAFALSFHGTASLQLPGTSVALPSTCPSRLALGIECPGCGLTRSFVALANGDFKQSLQFNRVGWLVALAVLAQIPYRLFAIWELRRGVVYRPWLMWIGYVLVTMLALNWLLKRSGL
jgi:hypothetical protein